MEPSALLESIDIGIVRQDATTKLTYANTYARRLLGLAETEGTPATDSLDPGWDAINPDGSPCPGPQHPAPVAMREKRVVRDAVLGVRRRDGQRVWLQVTAKPEVDGADEVRGVLIAFTDITHRIDERAATDAALRLSDAHYRAVLAAMGEGVVVLDAGGRLLSFNPVAERLLGLNADTTEVQCHAFAEDGRRLSAEELPWRRTLADGQPVRHAVVRLDCGLASWVKINADRLRLPGATTDAVVATLTDVTSERTALEALKAERSRLRLLTEAVPGVVFELVEGPTGARFTFMGPGVQQLIDVSADEVVADAQRFWARVHPQDLERVRRARVKALHDGEVFDEELRLSAPGGQRWARLRLSTPRKVDGGLVVHGLLLDISAQKQLDEKLRDAQRQESLGLLTAGVAHNFNNILATIVPTLEHLRTEGAELSRAAVDDAWRAAQSAGELVRQLTQVVRRQASAELERVDCGELLAEVADLCRRTFGRRVAVECVGTAEPVPVRARRSELHQVLLALCLNARDAMDATAAPALTLSLRQRDGHAELAVTDVGAGMSDEVMRRLGEPFFTTRPPGLGLAAALGILREFGGELRWASRLGEGSTFTVRLPLTALAPRASPPTRPLTRPARPLSGRRVLLIDDEALVRRSLRRVLERLGVEVLEADDGPAGLATLARGELDAVFVDLSMPEMRGDEVLRRIRAQWATLPVFILSGFVSEVDALATATAIIPKPFTNDAVRDALLSALPTAAPR